MSRIVSCIVSFLMILSGCNFLGSPLKIEDNSNIVFLGNTFAEGFQRHNYFETLLYQNFPNNDLVVRNLGWSADEVNLMPRPLNFPSLDEHLSKLKADVIFVSFGFNESYKGQEGLAEFKTNLESFLLNLKNKQFNERSAPSIVLISPIPYEQIDSNLPAEAAINAHLEMYVDAMGKVADELEIRYVDIYKDLKKAMELEENPLTTNGIHLNNKGRIMVAEMLSNALGFEKKNWKEDENSNRLREVIKRKNKQFFHVYRPSNSEYYVGRRKDWPGGQTLQSEILQIQSDVEKLDNIIWNYQTDSSIASMREMNHILNKNVNKPGSKIDAEVLLPDIGQFKIKDGYEIELYASELDFPMGNPVSMTFDVKGRLWLATMPSYPNYYPGNPPNDKILILEDLDSDGKADNYKVFADSLYLPLGFELGKGGVFVTEAPDLLFLKDTTGDETADVREYVLHGVGTEDAHHSISNYSWGPDGSLYMHMGTFLHSQIETPYGPQRGAYGTTWKYDPTLKKLDNYISYPYANPWGNVFNQYGDHLIADASTGRCHFASPLSSQITYPIKHTSQAGFLTADFAPKTCGIEIISSENFPSNVQGDILLNTFVGFQGIRQHKLVPDSSEYIGEEQEPLLQSTDPNFRPVDLKFGPDGALYVLDWFSPIIQHGEQGFREEMRDHTHGRIWRIRYSGNKLNPIKDLSNHTIVELLNELKKAPLREKYRIRNQLSEMLDANSISIVNDWASALSDSDSDSDLYKLEALWLNHRIHYFNPNLLDALLGSENDQVRAAAIKIMRNWRDDVGDYLLRLDELATDPSFKVRLETIVALSHERSTNSILSLLKILDLPVDEHIRYAMKETLKNLQEVWMSMLAEDVSFLEDKIVQANFLFSLLEDKELLDLPGFLKDDPQWKMFTWPVITEQEINILNQSKAYNDFLNNRNLTANQLDDSRLGVNGQVVIHLKTLPGKMKYDKEMIAVKSGQAIKLILDNDDNMAHNIVFVNPGQQEKVGKLADKMASESDAYERNFIPESKEVLFFSPLIKSGDSYTLEFTAPTEKGEYPYICTFPGHWQIMKGVLKVL